MEQDLFSAFDSNSDFIETNTTTYHENIDDKSVDEIVSDIIANKRSLDKADVELIQSNKKSSYVQPDITMREQSTVDSQSINTSERSNGESSQCDEDTSWRELVEKSSSRVQVHTIETGGGCLHEVCVSPDTEYVPLVTRSQTPAKEYAFVLDSFQREAIACIEGNQSVLVSAHTSAGKTVVAEYAIAVSLRDKQRVIYTTPIKALSNQKYREFSEQFEDVGLMTGDVTINPAASCLIMTTEILRSMLYRGSELMREVSWVVFDEIHYMRDKFRGYVWEETIILLPDQIHYVFLSATIPNARQFAEWITFLHKQPCHVVYTDYRPTPLQHYIYPTGGEGIHLVVDEKGQFREDNFLSAMSILSPDDSASGTVRSRNNTGNNSSGGGVFQVIKFILEKNLAPVIVFSFSKKECEAFALQMAKLDFNTDEEKKLVNEVFVNAMDVLSDGDKGLPQVEHVLPLLRRGIGIHHGGLLPILKETIEILFGEGLIKALFATETFAMGLNMPARTVLFTGCRKFDGKEFRWITSGEYIQMSGRAGRRGKDDKGIVIMMVDESISPALGKDIINGSADPLNSAFHLTYNMVLNLMRVEDINPEYMLEHSFYQFQNYTAIPKLFEDEKKLKSDVKKASFDGEDEVGALYKLQDNVKFLRKQLRSYITTPKYLVPFLNPGRVVKIVSADKDFGWCVIVNYHKSSDRQKNSKTKDTTDDSGQSSDSYIVDVLVYVSRDTAHEKDVNLICPASNKSRGEMIVLPVSTDLIEAVSAVRVKYPSDLRPFDNRMIVYHTIVEMKRRFSQGVPYLDPIKDMKIKDREAIALVDKLAKFEERLKSHPLTLKSCEDTESEDRMHKQMLKYERKLRLVAQLEAVRAELRRARSVLQMDELKCRKRVLRRLGFCSSCDVIETKGRVACELSSADELLVTELMLDGVFAEMNPSACAALLSCFVFDEKAGSAPGGSQGVKADPVLEAGLRRTHELARRLARVSVEAKLQLDEDEYVAQFKPALMEIVKAWCDGCSFHEICKMTDVFEGSIIRCFRRLEELLRQLVQSAKGIGNASLETKFNDAIKAIKRDIAFAASLYL